MKNDTAWAVERAREMLAVGINIQATGAATNEIVTAIIKSLLDHIDGFEAVADTRRTVPDDAGLVSGVSSDPPSSAGERMREAAQAVIDRWDTPNWKDAPATAVVINNLRAALALQGPSGKTPGAVDE